MQSHPTAYVDINASLDLLLSRILLTLGNKPVGLYISGSLTVGDFDYDSSDIDLIAATSSALDEEEVVRLKRMHEEIAHQEKMWYDRLEVAYILAKLCGDIGEITTPSHQPGRAISCDRSQCELDH